MEVQALFWIQMLTAVACFLQNAEYVYMHIAKMISGPRRTLALLDFLSLVMSLALFFRLDAAPILTLLYFFRFVFFRGPFNGGSDIMTHILLITLSIANVFTSQSLIFRAALLYLGLQTILSYFVAGLVKLQNGAWLQGFNLKYILVNSPYPIPSWVKRVCIEGPWALLLSWFILAFELSFPVVLLSRDTTILYVGMAILFHISNAFVLGLNRFVWAWLAAYPAIYYLSSFNDA